MRRPSPAMVVAVIALVVACAGSATAAVLVTGKDIRNNSVTGIDIRDRALRGKDIGSNTVTGRNVDRLSGRDVIPNGLDGSDIDEDTLEAVPRATRADVAARATTADALAGGRVSRIASRQAPGSGAATLYDAAGLRLTVQCSSAGAISVQATPTVDGGDIRVVTNLRGSNAQGIVYADNAFDAGDVANLVAGGTTNTENTAGTVTYASPAGDVTTIQYLAYDNDACTLAGTVVHATP